MQCTCTCNTLDIMTHHCRDPYQEGQSKLVKSEELKNLELPEEDDDVGGWAGYHEEVDYSKKVVFDDSSDDEDRPNHQPSQTKRKESSESGDIKTVCYYLFAKLLMFLCCY